MTLLGLEWLKIRRLKAFWVLVALVGVLIPLFGYMLSEKIITPGGKNAANMMTMDFGFPGVYDQIGYYSSLFLVFIGFVIIILITNEYRYKTLRQNVIDGLTRWQVFSSKALLVILLAVLTTVFVGVVMLVFGFVNSTSEQKWTTEIYKIGYFFVLSLNYFGLAMMLAFLIKRSGLAIGIYMLYQVMFEFILQQYLNWQFRPKFTPGDFLPLQCSDELLPWPVMKQLAAMSGESSTTANSSLLIASGLYIALYFGVSWLVLKKRDW